MTERTSQLAKARAIISVHSRFTAVRIQIPSLNVSTGLNKASFWSGLEPLAAGGSAAEHAGTLARASGRTSLEMTRGGAWLNRQTGLLGQRVNWTTQTRPQWGRLSSRFATQARGSVELYEGPRHAGPHSV